jgi:hypothetical protein
MRASVPGVEKQRFENAPCFDANGWLDMAEQSWLMEFVAITAGT